MASVIMFVIVMLFTFSNLITASENPIIGVLTQETYIIHHPRPEETSFIAASYVKYLESAGARVIPVWKGQDRDYYERVVKYTNGVIFPGGGTFFDTPNGYGTAAKHIYELAVDSNAKGVYYPLWGICLGMQALFFGAMQGKDIRQVCSSVNVAMPLNFTADFMSSRCFTNAPNKVVENLKTKNLTFNYHRFCIFEDVLKADNLSKDWRIISTNVDKKGTEFVSAVEHKHYPFYGFQFHPEKPIYEFKETLNIPHGIDAVQASQYFTNFFVEESRQNNNTFPSEELEKKTFIYNFNPIFSETNTSYEQVYVFENKDAKNYLLQ